MRGFPKFFGMATVGARGQVVIPQEARKSLKIKSGDKLIVISGPPKHTKMLSFALADDFSRFLDDFEKHISRVKADFSKESGG
ncbi:MAG: AbrB/MazE/SpoVT family DNA-binding domain-containing protein [Candidatus Omnitrophota bacterium]